MNGTTLVGPAGPGILRSVDDGATWHCLGLKEATAVTWTPFVAPVKAHPQSIH